MHLVEAELFHADMTKLIVAFCNFANSRNNVYNIKSCV
jgi:hypothetical protein